MWQTQFGWNGMEQTQSTFFQRMADVAVVGNTVTVTVPVDAIITLTTVETSEFCV
jgi:glycyl-tRNA synthetase alpha subunit